ncbi:hypothetical protein [Asaia bogorensis]|uniref:hypothetical protein n=1 Tax=Asaia bogorensis TaxID=91915 RepID=UPI0013CEE6F8|nr:hypothetical protein [Asaia bogorensis]
MSGVKLERLCADAMAAYGVIITPQQARDLLVVPDNMKERLAERLRSEVQAAREEIPALSHGLAERLSGFLRPGTLCRKRSELSLLLSAPLGDLRLSDVRTEVLASWLAEIEPSDESSLADGEGAGELPTPSPTDDAGAARSPIASLGGAYDEIFRVARGERP